MQRLLVLGLVACAAKSAAPDPAAIVAMTDRTEHDRKLDPTRKPVEMLTFFGIKAGMHVADLGAGSGYTTELVARLVGPSGKVIAQDTPTWDGPDLQGSWTERMKRPGLANTTHVMRAWDSPLPADATNLDAVTFVCAYHDVPAEKNDVHKLDAAVFAALKPHGVFIVIDNSATDGTGAADVERLHRIDEKLVRSDLEQAGFKFVADAQFLRNASDARDWNADPDADKRTHTQDRFVLKFEKP